MLNHTFNIKEKKGQSVKEKEQVQYFIIHMVILAKQSHRTAKIRLDGT